MRFLSVLLFGSLSLLSSCVSSASLSQLLSSSYIVDRTLADVNTNMTMGNWTVYQQVTKDNNSIQTSVNTKLNRQEPFNLTIKYEQAQVSGTGSSALDGPIFVYKADSYIPSSSSSSNDRSWLYCSYQSFPSRSPNYCSEIPESPVKYYVCGRDMLSNCTLTEIACRENDVMLPSIFYKINNMTGVIMEELESKNSTQVYYWTNVILNPTIGQFGDEILLPARDSCPDKNQRFPQTFGNAPVMPTQAPTTTVAPTGTPNGTVPTTTPNGTLPTTTPSAGPTTIIPTITPNGTILPTITPNGTILPTITPNGTILPTINPSSSSTGIFNSAIGTSSTISTLQILIPVLLSVTFLRF